jgi:prepilin-type N-terminal cleavage/methylation domain-containing protein
MLYRRPPRVSGFTLIELMIAVCIIGVLASVALPAFNQYIMNARASEGPMYLKQIYTGIAAYWDRPYANDQSLTATSASHCLTNECCGGPMGMVPPFPPGPEKRTGDWSIPAMQQVGFAPAGPVYSSYAWSIPDAALQGRCGLTEADFSSQLAYILISIINLDGDGFFGGYSLQVGIKGESMFRQPGFGTLRDANIALGADCAPLCVDGFVE